MDENLSESELLDMFVDDEPTQDKAYIDGKGLYFSYI